MLERLYKKARIGHPWSLFYIKSLAWKLKSVKYLNVMNFADNENSSDEGRAKKKKRGRDSSASSNSDSGFFSKDKESNKKRSKDDPLSLNTREKKRKLANKNIALLSENEIKDRYRYKKHTCQLSDLPTKTKVIHLKV